jgi:hypothetical protein
MSDRKLDVRTRRIALICNIKRNLEPLIRPRAVEDFMIPEEEQLATICRGVQTLKQITGLK